MEPELTFFNRNFGESSDISELYLTYLVLDLLKGDGILLLMGRFSFFLPLAFRGIGFMALEPILISLIVTETIWLWLKL